MVKLLLTCLMFLISTAHAEKSQFNAYTNPPTNLTLGGPATVLATTSNGQDRILYRALELLSEINLNQQVYTPSTDALKPIDRIFLRVRRLSLKIRTSPLLASSPGMDARSSFIAPETYTQDRSADLNLLTISSVNNLSPLRTLRPTASLTSRSANHNNNLLKMNAQGSTQTSGSLQ